MQEETKSPAVGKTTATADDPAAAAAGSRQRSSSTKTSGSQPREYESRVLVLYTGGTIGMQSQDTGHGGRYIKLLIKRRYQINFINTYILIINTDNLLHLFKIINYFHLFII